MGIQKSEAILLSKRDIRETSSLVVFYTEGFGKIKGLVKGARGAQAKFGLYLSEFSKFDIVYYEKRKTETYLITQADLKDSLLPNSGVLQVKKLERRNLCLTRPGKQARCATFKTNG